MTYKKKLFILLGSVILYSCIQNHPPKQGIQLVTSEKLRTVIDSIISLNNNQNTYELFVHKISEYRGFMLLHAGTEPYYDKEKLSLGYLISDNKEVKIYSGVESYFNLPNKEIDYGRTEGIVENKNHLLWGIYMYKDSIIGIHSLSVANPFLLIPSPPFSE